MESEKRKLYLFRGLPGSGKSTAAATMEGWDHRVLEADMFFQKDGIYNRDVSKLSEAHAWCLAETKLFLSWGIDVSVANTFVRLWEMEPYLDIPNVDITVIEMKTQYQNTHGVPDEAVQRMAEIWEEIPKDRGIKVITITETDVNEMRTK